MPSPKARQVRHRFQNSLDMVAARPVTFVDLTQPSGTENAWGMDSPTLGWMSSVVRRSSIESPSEEPAPVPSSSLTVPIRPLEIRKAVHVAPLNIKKIRRRGFMSGVEAIQLGLPPSPLPPSRSPLGVPQVTTPPSQASVTFAMPPTSPQTALTFTAEWDLTQRSFVFTPFDTAFSSPPIVFTPRSAGSTIPDDVKSILTVADSQIDLGMPSPKPIPTLKEPLSIQVPVADASDAEIFPPSPSSSIDTPLSEIFDEPPHSLSHSRKSSQTTLSPISPVDPLVYAKPRPSTSSLKKQVNLHRFGEELTRSMHVGTCDGEIDKTLYEEIDEDLLMAPMVAFEQMLWDSSCTDSREHAAPQEEIASRLLAIPPDAPFRNMAHASRNASWDGAIPAEERAPFLRHDDLPANKHSSKTRQKRKFSEDLVATWMLKRSH